MRNLKRALSLALATVMTLGLMVVGTGAVGYTDVTSEDNQEAIEVLQAVGIMTGVTEDEFDPDGLVTRNQMAVIMSQLLNLDYNYYRGINAFTDVPAWAAPYVAACAAEGVTAGVLTIEGVQHKIAETIVRNTAAKNQKVLTMDSMQSTTSKDVKNGTTYLSVMEKNLSVLKEALG